MKERVVTVMLSVATTFGLMQAAPERLKQLEVARATGHSQPDAAIAHLRVLEPALDRHAHQFGEQRQSVIDLADGPADVVEPGDSNLVCHFGPFVFVGGDGILRGCGLFAPNLGS